MYEILENGKNKSKQRNYRIYKNPEKVYDEYFCHGIEGRDELLEGIIFFSHNSEIARIQKTNYNKAIRNKSELERTIERAIDIYLQFYRFVDLNDRDKVPHYYHLENERELRKNIEMQIRNKLKQLENSNDDYMFISNQERSQNPQRYDEDGRQRDNRIRRIKEEGAINDKINKAIKDKEKLIKRELNDYEKSQIAINIRNEYLDTKKIKIEENRILYSEREYLNNLEKLDKMKYYRIWLHTRIARLKNRGHIDDSVREEIELLTKQGENVKALQKRKEERKKKMEEIHKANQEEER